MHSATKRILKGLVILSIGGLLFYGGVSLAYEWSDTTYEYTVKAEQVSENEMVDESEDFDTLTDAEREMVFDAFKKSDHFFGGASVSLDYGEPIDNIEKNEWKVVRVKGVPILMAIEGPEEFETLSGYSFFGLSAILLGVVGLTWGLVTLGDGITQRRRLP